MSFEVICGQCTGRLTVEQAGVVVACPHCGAHLSIADPGAAETSAADAAPIITPELAAPAVTTAPDVAAPQPAAPSPAPAEAAFPSFETSPAAAAPAETGFEGGFPGFDPHAPLPGASTEPAEQLAEPPAEQTLDPAPIESVAIEPAAVEPIAATEPTAAAVPGSTVFPDPSPTMVESEPQNAPAEASPPPTDAAAENEVSPTAAPSPAVTTPAAATSSQPAGGVSRTTFIMVASYASAMTIAAVVLLLQVLNPTASVLESLPDLEPPRRDEDGKVGYRVVPEDAPMPIGHSLKLGEEQRFGNLKITPLRITRGPLEFDHYNPRSGATKKTVPGVLKLWLKIENVSADQSIAPLRGLVFHRDSSDIDNERANTFVCRTSEKRKDGTRLLVYDHNLKGNWDIRSMNVDDEIPPGQSVETFIPTVAEGVDNLFGSDEPLVWRFHFRKGYGPKKHGVTTVVEVNFAEDEVTFDTKPGEAESTEAGRT